MPQNENLDNLVTTLPNPFSIQVYFYLLERLEDAIADNIVLIPFQFRSISTM